MPLGSWSGQARPPAAQTGLGECRTVFSLGEGMSGGMKYVKIIAKPIAVLEPL